MTYLHSRGSLIIAFKRTSKYRFASPPVILRTQGRPTADRPYKFHISRVLFISLQSQPHVKRWWRGQRLRYGLHGPEFELRWGVFFNSVEGWDFSNSVEGWDFLTPLRGEIFRPPLRGEIFRTLLRGEIFRTHPASCSKGTESLSQGVKRPRRGADHSAPSSARVMYG